MGKWIKIPSKRSLYKKPSPPTSSYLFFSFFILYLLMYQHFFSEFDFGFSFDLFIVWVCFLPWQCYCLQFSIITLSSRFADVAFLIVRPTQVIPLFYSVGATFSCPSDLLILFHRLIALVPCYFIFFSWSSHSVVSFRWYYASLSLPYSGHSIVSIC